jgi:hypothetical protein
MKGALSQRRVLSSRKNLKDAVKKRTPNSSEHSTHTSWVEYEPRDIVASPVLGAASPNAEEVVELETEDQRKHTTLLNLAAQRPHQNWERFAARSLRKGYWSRLGDLAKTLNELPEDIELIFQRIEKNWPSGNFSIDSNTRLQFYKEFTRTALGSTVLRFNEVETLIQRMQLASHISRVELNNRMNSKLETTQKGADQNEFFDFELFASLACDLHELQRKILKVMPAQQPKHRQYNPRP